MVPIPILALVIALDAGTGAHADRSHAFQARRIVLSPDLAALDAELRHVFDQVERRMHQRDLTIQDMEAVAGDAVAERDLLGMTDAEYLATQNRVADILTRAQRLMPRPPTGPLVPLWQDSRGEDWICTTDRTVEEMEDGTIVITDHDSCEQVFTGPEPSWPGDPVQPHGGDGPVQLTPFERDCTLVGGVITRNTCMCSDSAGCIEAVLDGALAEVGCALAPVLCPITLYQIGKIYWKCRQRPCDGVNRLHGR